MKNLPEPFPIRYAVIVNNRYDDVEEQDDERPILYNETADESLFSQLILYLRQNPITGATYTKDDLSIMAIRFNLLGKDLVSFAKLGATTEWTESAKKSMEKMFPDARAELSSIGWFRPGLYSYRGSAEQPAFLRMYNRMDDTAYLSKTFGFKGNKSYLKRIREVFERAKQGENNDLIFQEMLNRYKRPMYISAPYSSIWKSLDEGQFDGAYPIYKRAYDKTDADKKLMEGDVLLGKNDPVEIKIAVCDCWQSLFVEEVSAITDAFKYCKCCGKALPFGHSIEYCPDIPENKECRRKRNRDRKSQKY